MVLPIDTDGDGRIAPDEEFYDTKDRLVAAIAEGKYPSPPARDLYLVTKGVPTDPVAVAFLEYVLGDGQAKNIPAGYINTPENKIRESLALLESANQSE